MKITRQGGWQTPWLVGTSLYYTYLLSMKSCNMVCTLNLGTYLESNNPSLRGMATLTFFNKLNSLAPPSPNCRSHPQNIHFIIAETDLLDEMFT